MKKINIISIIAFALITGVIIQSCNNDDSLHDSLSFKGENYTLDQLNDEAQKISQKDILKTLNNHYGISKITNLSKEFSKATTSKLKTLNLDQNKYEITEYEFDKSKEHLYIAKDTKNSDEYQVLRTIEDNNKIKITSKKILYHDKLVSIRLKENHNKFINSNELNLKSLFTINEANAEWCQQEPADKGSASNCQSREYDEFTSDWVGFVAYWSNPTIPILIAAMCRC